MTSNALVLRFAVVALLAATAACSFTMGFDGFAGSGDTPSDGGPDSPSARDDSGNPPGVDGSSNVDAGDSGAIDADAGPVDQPPVFVDGGSFCGTQESTAFCEDFDTTDLPVHWVKEGVFAKLTSTAAKSAPNVFLLDVPESTAGGTFVSKITKTMDSPSTNLVVAFDFSPEKVNLTSSFLILAALEYTKLDAKYSMRLVYSNGSVRVEESNLVPPPNNKDSYHPFFTIPTGQWSRVKLDVVASGATPGVQVSLDGTPVGARDALTPTPGIDPTPTLILGAVFAGNPNTGWKLRYDNVTVTYR
jgi:hypothetical protein